MLTVEPEIVSRYVAQGQVRLIFRDVLNHGPRSGLTSEAAACAGKQNKFWEMHALLFQNQNRSYEVSEADFTPFMQDLASQITGLDQAAFTQCYTTHETRPAIDRADAEHRQRGITSQPIFEIGDQRLFGFQSIEVMSKVIDTALSE